MKKIALIVLTTVIISVGYYTFAEEGSPRGDATDPIESLPDNDPENVPIIDEEQKEDSAIDKKPTTTQDAGPASSDTTPSTHTKTYVAPIRPLIDDSRMSIDLTNMYYKRSYRHAAQSGLTVPAGWQQWGQSMALNFVSGYYYNIIGADFSLYGALKLSGSHPLNANDQLLSVKNNNKYANTYGRLGRANIKIQLEDQRNNNIVMRYGRIGVDTALVADSTRLLESSYQGASLDASSVSLIKGLSFYAFYLERLIPRTGSNSALHFKSSLGTNIKNIALYGIRYVIGDNKDSTQSYLYLNAESGRSKNYVDHSFAQATYYYPFSKQHNIIANAQFRQGKKSGALWLPTLDGYDNKAYAYNMNLLLTTSSGLSLGASFAHVTAKNNNQTGVDSHQFNTQLAANDYGSTSFWTARQVSLFNYDGEHTYQARLGYNFTSMGLAGFSTTVTHTRGTHINKAVGLKREQETDLAVQYTFQEDSPFDGFSLIFQGAQFSSKALASAETAGKSLIDLRFMAKYSVALF